MDGTDGSSTAAHGAHIEEEQNSGGFFRRILGALSPSDTTDQAMVEHGVTAPAASGHGMLNLRRLRVEDVAVPKSEIDAVPESISADELLQVFRHSGFTRLPVYSGTMDTPIGLIHLKDFVLNYSFGEDSAEFDLKKMLRPLLFVPPSMSIGVLLTKMQAERRHMALVIDEYGGTDGLVTIEDLIEQVIGDIEDEHDIDEGQYWTKEKSGSYLALSKTPIEDFHAETGVDLTHSEEIDPEEIDTLGGLVFMLAGQVPSRGQVVRHPDGHEFEVVDADPRRIKRLRVRLNGAKDEK